MAVYLFMTRTYARNIYLYGTTKFSSLPSEYVPEVMKYAAGEVTKDDAGTTSIITRADLEAALTNSYITQQEHDDTIALITAQ